MPPCMYNPAQGADFYGPSGVFYWWNAHGSGAPPHQARSVCQWRVKVGSHQYGWDYFQGYPVGKDQLYDPNVLLSPIPRVGSTCWALVEWKVLITDPGWTAGTPTSFTYR